MSPYQYGANNPVNNIDVNGDTIVVNPNPNGLIDNVRIFFGFDTKYQKDVKADLQQLKKDDKEIGEMIIELEKSKNVHSITRTKRGKSNSSGFDREKAKKDMEEMLDYIDKLNELDTSDVEPMSHVFPVQNVFREDVVTNGDNKEATLANAPLRKEDSFEVPKTIG